MPRVLLRLAYDGTAYAGWQRQENGPSVQAALERALAPLAGGEVTVHAAGRTDAGVHADGQAVHVDLPHGIEPAVVLRATNTRLPADVRVRSAVRVPDDFHARYSACAKTYRYAWYVSRLGHPLLARTHWTVLPPVDLAAMASAAARLEGTHDFAAFQSVGTRVSDTVRTITGVDFGIRPSVDTGLRLTDTERIVELELRGDGFLRHMVRAIAGTLLDVGYGRRPPDALDRLLTGALRGDAGPNAPPHGLTLISVEYPGESGRPTAEGRRPSGLARDPSCGPGE